MKMICREELRASYYVDSFGGGDGGGTLVDNAELVGHNAPQSALFTEAAVLVEQSALAARELHDSPDGYEQLVRAVV